MVAAALTVAPALAQQTGDPNFKFDHKNPAYPEGKGPHILIDEAHGNFHTADGRYKPFAELLRGSGYRVSGLKGKISRKSLTDCRVLVIANPMGARNAAGDWSYPHTSAFTREEIQETYFWIGEGGSLLLFVDHPPFPGATADLGAMLGLGMLDAYAYADTDRGRPDTFTLADGTLKPHAILNGRNSSEKVDRIVTFTGHAFHSSTDYQSFMVFGPGAMGATMMSQNFSSIPRNEWPRFPIEGWSHGASRRLGEGRVAILGEAAMCTAQLAGPDKNPMGMNNPAAPQNAQFCLNVVHWLDGLLDERD